MLSRMRSSKFRFLIKILHKKVENLEAKIIDLHYEMAKSMDVGKVPTDD